MGSMKNKQKAREVVEAVKRYNMGGVDVVMLPLNAVKPNAHNPNRMDEETFEKEKASISEFGMIVPIIVRKAADDQWEIVDGEHRYKACLELGHVEILAVDLGGLTDQKAKKLTIIANDLRGTSDPGLLAQLITDLSENESVEQLAKLLPQSQVELESMIASLKPYDPGPMLDLQPTVDGGDASTTSLVGMGKDIRVQLGSVKGTVPEAVFKLLMEEYVNSVQHVRTKNVELVVGDLVQRLQAHRRPVKPASNGGAVEGASEAKNV